MCLPKTENYGGWPRPRQKLVGHGPSWPQYSYAIARGTATIARLIFLEHKTSDRLGGATKQGQRTSTTGALVEYGAAQN